jgi:hypothetical protein
MYPGFNAQSSKPFATRRTLNHQQVHSIQGSATDGFDIWWQKTFAQHTAMAAELSALMRADRRVNPIWQAHVGQTH